MKLYNFISILPPGTIVQRGPYDAIPPTVLMIFGYDLDSALLAAQRQVPPAYEIKIAGVKTVREIMAMIDEMNRKYPQYKIVSPEEETQKQAEFQVKKEINVNEFKMSLMLCADRFVQEGDQEVLKNIISRITI